MDQNSTAREPVKRLLSEIQNRPRMQGFLNYVIRPAWGVVGSCDVNRAEPGSKLFVYLTLAGKHVIEIYQSHDGFLANLRRRKTAIGNEPELVNQQGLLDHGGGGLFTSCSGPRGLAFILLCDVVHFYIVLKIFGNPLGRSLRRERT
jgi:hypothetical protein